MKEANGEPVQRKPNTAVLRSVAFAFLSMLPDAPWAGEADLVPDPFATQDRVSRSPALASQETKTADPCLIDSRRKEAWTLADVLDQALCHNPQTRQAWANARFQAAQLGSALAAYLPSVSINGAYSHGTTPSGTSLSTFGQGLGTGTGTSFGAGGGFRQGAQTRVTPVVSLNYLLFDFGGREAKVDNARRTLEAADWSHAATLQSVLLTAVQAYYQLFAAQAALQAAEAAEQSSAEALQAAKVRYAVGAAALADQLQAQTAYSQARLNRQKSAGDAQIAQGALANVMGLKPDKSLQIAAPASSRPDERMERDVQALMEEAKAQRPDLAAAEAQVKAAEAGVRVARAAGLPSLSLTSNYLYSDSSTGPSSQGWSVGLQVSVPLFTGFANTYQIHAAQELVAVQEANRDKLDQSVALDVWRAFHNLNTATETFLSSEDLLASATESERVAMGRYKAGAGNILDLLSAQANLANARFQHVQARYNWHIGKAQLAQALGRLDLAAASDSPSRPVTSDSP